MNESLIYTSNCTMKNLWQKYEIFDDRIELHTWLGNIKIPFDKIKQVEVMPPVLKSIRLHMEKCQFGVKLDTLDWNEHIVLEKEGGFMRQVLFTPEDPAEFKRILDQAMTRFQRQSGGTTS